MKKKIGKRAATVADVDIRVEELAIMTAHSFSAVERRLVNVEDSTAILKSDMKRVVEVVERIDMKLSAYAGQYRHDFEELDGRLRAVERGSSA